MQIYGRFTELRFHKILQFFHKIQSELLYICVMAENQALEMVYSTDFHLIGAERFRGWCVHLVCLSGEGRFTYNARDFVMGKNDAAIITHPEKVEATSGSYDLQVEMIVASMEFLWSQIPANSYGIGGGISLFVNPIIHLSEQDAGILVRDIHNIRDRMPAIDHFFYHELLGSLVLPMIYDLYHFHARDHVPTLATDRTMYIVRNLIALLEGGRCKKHREVAYYAGQLNVTPKYLSETVKRRTGKSVTYYIDRYTVTMVKEYLDKTNMSISEIADEMNFASLSYFSRYVAKHIGMSPKDYRKSLMPK